MAIITAPRVKAEAIQTAELEGYKLEIFVPFVAGCTGLIYHLYEYLQKSRNVESSSFVIGKTIP